MDASSTRWRRRSRRSLLKAGAGALLGGALGGLGLSEARAATKRRVGDLCRKGGDCASGVCLPKDATGRQRCGCAAPADCPTRTCQDATCSAGTCDYQPHCVAPRVCDGSGGCSCPQGTVEPNCEPPACLNDCSGHGICSNGICACDAGWIGPDCSIPSIPTCVNNCSGHGVCAAGTCVCNPGWSGLDCSTPSIPTCVPACVNGVCTAGICTCSPGWMGLDCSTPAV